MKDYKELKNGRWINKHTGFFVDKKMANKLNKLAKKSTKHHKKINYPKNRAKRASKLMVIRKYDYKYNVELGKMNNEDILYISELLKHLVNKRILKRDHM